eukprot:TRINITY_DN2439_c0_g1_i2.p1 TRINITY_DN2439_c0_g1~~TRINITY_DN2439_c0_g1_i2.p1  ORF type:complete len:307 (+),score=7.79 TRINITY_DN2439_c0_g1_i2:120-1040(+)
MVLYNNMMIEHAYGTQTGFMSPSTPLYHPHATSTLNAGIALHSTLVPTDQLASYHESQKQPQFIYGGFPLSVASPYNQDYQASLLSMGCIDPKVSRQQEVISRQSLPSYCFSPSSPYPYQLMDGFALKSTKRMFQQEQLSANKDRTIYVGDIHSKITEQEMARFFSRCGEVVDCRLCGDPNSPLRFAFIEFSQATYKSGVFEALKLNGTQLRGTAIRISRSKTAIIPIKRELLPKSKNDMEKCQRTIYVSNIDRRLTEKEVRNFFQTLSVDKKTGCLPLRVSPSKTPVRSRQQDSTLRSPQKSACY